jgi:hypothetical protein
MFTGAFEQPLVAESRHGRHDKTHCPQWVCLDFDGVEGFTHNTIVTELTQFVPGMEDTSYVLQYSSSSRMHGDTSLRAHLFFRLEEPIEPSALQTWLTGLNVASKLRDKITLTNSMNSLHWPLDPVLGQNSRMIFIAPPQFGPGVRDPHEGDDDPRLQFIQKANDALSIQSIEDAMARYEVDREKVNIFNKLRGKAGLSRRDVNYFSQPMCKKPQPAEVTGRKEDGNFVRLNLNGGDSWGYYYIKDKHDVLYNFKDEPLYPLDKIVPEYYQQHYSEPDVEEPVPTSQNDLAEHVAFAFRYPKTMKCYWVRIDFRSNVERMDENGVLPLKRLELSDPLPDNLINQWLKDNPANVKNAKQLPHFNIIWDPNPKLAAHIDVGKRVVNTYEPTDIKPTSHDKPKVPVAIETLLRHLTNNPKGLTDLEYDKFLAWLAYIVQKRDKTETAWIFHGVEGTGKGLLQEFILQPLFHNDNVSPTTNKTLQEKFTDPIVNKLIVVVDESDANEMNASDEARLKHWITDRFVTGRNFHKAHGKVRTYCNFIFCSNKAVPVRLSRTDRRYNVAPRQEQTLVAALGGKEKISQLITGIQAGLPEFLQYLLQRKVKFEEVSSPLNNPPKEKLARDSQSTSALLLQEISNGDTEMLSRIHAQIQEQGATQFAMTTGSGAKTSMVLMANEFMQHYEKYIKPGKDYVISPTQLSALLTCVTGNPPRNATQLVKLLSPQGMEFANHQCPTRGKTVYGIYFPLSDEED